MPNQLGKINFEPNNEDIVRILGSKNVYRILDEIVHQAIDISGCQFGFIYAFVDKRWTTICSRGRSIVESRNWPNPKLKDYSFLEKPFEYGDLSNIPFFSNSRPVVEYPYLRYSIGIPLRISNKMGHGNHLGIWCVDPKPGQTDQTNLPALQKFGELASDVIDLICDLSRLKDNLETAAEVQLHDSGGSSVLRSTDGPAKFGPDPLTYFLANTLIKRPRVLHRDKRSYLGARAWRKASKPTQLAALKSLKINPPDEFVDLICEDLAAVIKDVHGVRKDAIVTSVPCGHSGPGCLASKIGVRVANKLGLEFEPLFEPLAVRGTSHPKANVRRPNMVLKKEETRTIILVDDVATSGSHIAEATALLLKHSANVWPAVWLAD